MSAIMSIGQKPDISQGPLSKSQGQGQGALKQSVSRTEVVTPEIRDHVTMGRSCDQTGSKSSRDPSCDQAPKRALTLSDKESGDKEREHTLMHAYFCRRDLCYVHDRY
jgi:hypothetical protein